MTPEHDRLARGARRSRWPLAWGEALAHLCEDAAFRRALTDDLVGCGFAALLWESRPVSVGTLDAPFEYVALDCPALAGARPEPEPFAAHIGAHAGTENVVRFPNLGGDAELVVPCAATGDSAYAHLAAFLRRAPAGQVDALWRTLGAAIHARLARTSAPLWVSTNGLGVAWLHVRLDARPKYYGHAPYRQPIQAG